MVATVSSFCKSYFSGFKDLATFQENHPRKNFIGVMKIISYCTFLLPIVFGVLYATSSLIGRVTASDNLSSEDERVSSVGQRVLSQTIEQQLDDFFTSTSRVQRIFSIDETRVGVIYNPSGESLRVGFMTVSDNVVLISDRAIPDEIVTRISARIPSGLSHSTLCLGSINGRSTFSYLGFE